MDYIVLGGAALCVIGLLGIIWCIISVLRDRKADLTDDQLKDRLQKAVAWNMGAFMVSAVGLMMVVVGVILG